MPTIGTRLVGTRSGLSWTFATAWLTVVGGTGRWLVEACCDGGFQVGVADGVTGMTDRRPDLRRGRRHQPLVALAFRPREQLAAGRSRVLRLSFRRKGAARERSIIGSLRAVWSASRVHAGGTLRASERRSYPDSLTAQSVRCTVGVPGPGSRRRCMTRLGLFDRSPGGAPPQGGGCRAARALAPRLLAAVGQRLAAPVGDRRARLASLRPIGIRAPPRHLHQRSVEVKHGAKRDRRKGAVQAGRHRVGRARTTCAVKGEVMRIAPDPARS